MKRRAVFSIFCLALLLLVGGAVVVAQGGSAQPVTRTASGGHYRLLSLDAGGDILGEGGSYMLWGPAAPELQGAGCCCTYLPCVLRSFP